MRAQSNRDDAVTRAGIGTRGRSTAKTRPLSGRLRVEIRHGRFGRPSAERERSAPASAIRASLLKRVPGT
jgi:hypothetical protein